MAWRKVLAMLLVVVAVSPAWGAAEPLGSITTSSASSIRDTNLTEGSTVFSGDVISVAANGATRIALKGGTRVEVLGNSSVRLQKVDEKIQMSVQRGQASFYSSGNNGISALVADATVRPVNGAETSAVIQSLNDMHAVISSEKGSLLVTTAHDGKTYTISEGEAVDLSGAEQPAAANAPQSGNPAPAGKSAPAMYVPSKTVVIWTAAILGAGAVAAAVVLVRREHKPSATEIANEVSPSKIN